MPTVHDPPPPPPCHGRMPLFLVPVDDDNPAYDPVKAKALCATCPAHHFDPCARDAGDDLFLIRAGSTPQERGAYMCRVCYGTDFDTVRHSGTGNPTRRCKACHRAKQRERRARL